MTFHSCVNCEYGPSRGRFESLLPCQIKTIQRSSWSLRSQGDCFVTHIWYECGASSGGVVRNPAPPFNARRCCPSFVAQTGVTREIVLARFVEVRYPAVRSLMSDEVSLALVGSVVLRAQSSMQIVPGSCLSVNANVFAMITPVFSPLVSVQCPHSLALSAQLAMNAEPLSGQTDSVRPAREAIPTRWCVAEGLGLGPVCRIVLSQAISRFSSPTRAFRVLCSVTLILPEGKPRVGFQATTPVLPGIDLLVPRSRGPSSDRILAVA